MECYDEGDKNEATDPEYSRQRDSWSWEFQLEREAGGSHTLSCEQIFEDDPLEIDPVSGLRNGADIYEALRSMLDNCGYHLGDRQN
jgi:hypothetical protein